MTEQSRKTYTTAQNVALVSQVNRICPLCDKLLFNMKNGINYKAYEIAHIYPLNPTPEEIDLLMNEERLGGDDVNHEDNVIPLCPSCHSKYDKRRTVSEYRELLDIKKRLIERSGQEAQWSNYSIEDNIRAIIDKLYSESPDDPELDIEYDPKSIDNKVDDSITLLTVRKIKNNVSDYFPWLRRQMEIIDKGTPEASKIILQQVKTYYLKQKQRDISQQAIFDNIVQWLNVKTHPQSIDAAEIITSFFVQNCEVFE